MNHNIAKHFSQPQSVLLMLRDFVNIPSINIWFNETVVNDKTIQVRCGVIIYRFKQTVVFGHK